MKQQGQIIRSYGRRFIVGATASNTVHHPRQASITPVASRRTVIINGEQAVIENCARAALYRQDDGTVDCANVCASVRHRRGASPAKSCSTLPAGRRGRRHRADHIVNKGDLPETADWLAKLQSYRELGYLSPSCPASSELLPLVKGQTRVAGQSAWASRR
jgi:ribosome biogenesis GTPase